MKYFLLIFLFQIVIQAKGQNENLKQRALNKFKFTEYSIPLENDTIYYYLNKKASSIPDKVVIYLQGTTPIPEPFFQIDKVQNGYSYLTYFPSDYESLSDEYQFVIIALPGVPVVKGYGSINLEKYHNLNSLDYRVFAADTVINDLTSRFLNIKKVIVYGHSEGAFVAPKLATVNKKITHLGVWGGSALPDFYDFIQFERKANLKGEQSDSITHNNITKIIEQFKDITKDSLNTVPSDKNEIAEYTNKRWWSYAEPTINHLVKLKIPIYIQLGTEDESSPIESNYLIPLEFARLGKTNLSFNVCVGCDHGFVNIKTREDKWSEIFKEFINWTEEN